MTSSLIAAVLALALLTVLPGPDIAVVTRITLAHGRQAAVRGSFGVVSGLLVWGLLTVAGLAAVLAASAEAYTAVKLVGALYLLWLGAQTLWRSRRSYGSDEAAAMSGPPGRPWRTGLLTNLTNPKIAVFYTSLLPQLVPDGAPRTPTLVALVLAHALISLSWLLLYTTAVSRAAVTLRRPRVRRALERVTGVVLVGFGVRVLAAGRQ